jgi:uncharacterized protein (DUF2336 family)
MSRREFDDAQALLLPLAYDPHNASLREAARQLLEQARAHRLPGADEQAPATEG